MVKTGLEVFLGNVEKYKGRRIALIVNQTSVTRDCRYIWDVLEERGLRIRRLFSPEHGIFSTEQDQAAVKRQPHVGCDVVSLYGDSYDSLIPDETALDDIDLVLFDVQDVGSRYYTYVNTMALFMEAIDGKDMEMMILDRPNPLGGIRVEGPLLMEGFVSFVGVFPVPIRHGMTAAELALLYKDFKKLDVNLSVVMMEGWKPSMFLFETGLPWIPPSPNMPTEETAFVYPGYCLFEGLNVSEGRGTTTPFQLLGAPFIDPYEWVARLGGMDLQGVIFRPVYFKPTFHKYADEVAGGVFIHVRDRTAFKPFLTGVAAVKALTDLYGDRLVFLKDVYEFNSVHPTFDLLTGGSRIREMILSGSCLREIENSWMGEENDFAMMRKEYLLYER
ncbi:MAG: DUF1343 domain-containing protein [bacterium]